MDLFSLLKTKNIAKNLKIITINLINLKNLNRKEELDAIKIFKKVFNNLTNKATVNSSHL
jgi:hypothetical protein